MVVGIIERWRVRERKGREGEDSKGRRCEHEDGREEREIKEDSKRVFISFVVYLLSSSLQSDLDDPLS